MQLPQPRVHRVRRGENLDVIARQYGLVSWEAVYKAECNREFRQKRPLPHRIFEGDELRIPPDARTLAKARLDHLMHLRRDACEHYERVKRELRRVRAELQNTSFFVDAMGAFAQLFATVGLKIAEGLTRVALSGKLTRLAASERGLKTTHVLWGQAMGLNAKALKGRNGAALLEDEMSALGAAKHVGFQVGERTVGFAQNTEVAKRKNGAGEEESYQLFDPQPGDTDTQIFFKVVAKSWFDMSSPSYWTNRYFTDVRKDETPQATIERALKDVEAQEVAVLKGIDKRMYAAMELLSEASRPGQPLNAPRQASRGR